MVPRYPGFIWRPDDGNRGGDGNLPGLPDVLTLHEAVSPNPTSVFGWVQTAHACHAYNGKGGYAEQYADLDRHVEGVADGNDHCITLESYDGLHPQTINGNYSETQTDDPAVYGTSANTGRWDAGQCERAADFLAWCNVVLGSVALAELPNSIRGQSGVAPHRWGIAPWRVSGGEVWTRHDGKPCPGDLRVQQIPGIVARAKVIAAAVRAGTCTWLPTGEVDLPSALARTNPPATSEEDELMALQPDTIKQLSDLIDARIKNAYTDTDVLEVDYVDVAMSPNAQKISKKDFDERVGRLLGLVVTDQSVKPKV